MTSLFIMSVFAEKTYVSAHNTEIDTIIIKLNVVKLEISIDSLTLRSIQSNRPEAVLISQEVNIIDSVNTISSEGRNLLKPENNHLLEDSLGLKPINSKRLEEALIQQALNAIDSISIEKSGPIDSLKIEKRYLTIDPPELESFHFNFSEDTFITQTEDDFDSVRSEIPNLLRIENNQSYNLMPLSVYDSQPLLNLSFQYEQNYEHNTYKEIIRLDKKRMLDKLKVIGLYSAAVIFNAIGDGLNNSNSKTVGHIFNAVSIGVLLSSPFLIDYNKSKWYWYILSYTAIRVTLFDATYNLTTKRPINYVGSTALTDKIHREIDLYNASKAVGLVVGLTIPLKLL